MNLNSIISKLQSIFGVTKSELVVVFFIVVGLLGGVIIQNLSGDKEQDKRSEEIADIVYHSLDSLAEIQRTSYIGSDINDSSFQELATADTLVKKDFFSSQKKKEFPSGKINLNTASKVELMKLPGVGEKTAIAILEYRQSTRFAKPSDIMKIKGIGPKKFEKMKEFLDVR
ncbi:MAG: helix-hairpin-helix domain-containing protein [Bacteroidetes bacterium]|nr:MAG: helix-hairpin-helix domain-containing protein [Bacteroidota bacterium]